MENYNQMDVPTSTAFDIFFNGIIPILYSTSFEPLLSPTLKSKIEDLVILFVEPLIPLFYAFNKITCNQFTKKYFIFTCIYCIFLSITFISHYLIFIWFKKTNRYFKYKSLTHCIITLYLATLETSTRFLPVICLENIGELRNIAFKAPNAMVVFGIILAFLILVLILPHILYANRDEFPVFGNIIFALHIFSSCFSSIVYLVIIPSNVIYVKIAFNINLLLIMRFFSILEDKPSNKKRGWGCVVLFAFDDTEGIEKELKKEDRGQYWYTPYLSRPIIKPITKIINDTTKKNDKEIEYDEDKSICNKANILYYYKYGKVLEEKRIYQSTGTTPHEFVLERYIPGNNLHNEIKKANKVYTLFDGIGIEKIDYIESFSAEDIARLEYKEINEIINRINKIPYP
ncbi:hypothetical protein RhiirA1_498898 [Rhizophagus irregularis]|uniref:Uncharacterized protein n=1 Tax=Rhizophagus irregularis TaxID=588596 RepID=A0A2N0R1J3_9GLOM|nr:hypothetical protein RhiirA1_498898 [Rhizophagus irregularis]